MSNLNPHLAIESSTSKYKLFRSNTFATQNKKKQNWEREPPPIVEPLPPPTGLSGYLSNTTNTNYGRGGSGMRRPMSMSGSMIGGRKVYRSNSDKKFKVFRGGL